MVFGTIVQLTHGLPLLQLTVARPVVGVVSPGCPIVNLYWTFDEVEKSKPKPQLF